MSSRINEYHGDDAKVLTTAEVEALPEHGDEDGGMPGVVLVDRDDLLATTRALAAACAMISDLTGVLHAVVLDWDGADLGTVKAGLIDDARVILTKAFKEES